MHTTHGSSINGFKKRPGTFYFPKEKNPKDIENPKNVKNPINPRNFLRI